MSPPPTWPAVPPVPARPPITQFVVATGRLRNAGYWVCGGGLAIAIAILFQGNGTESSGGYVIVWLGIAAGLIFLGIQVLKDRVTKGVMIALWVLAVIDVLLIIGAVAAAHKAGDGSLTGRFYMAVAGLIASVVGTVMVQTTRRDIGVNSSARPAQLSPDRAAWWDGQAWRDASVQAPPGHPRSPDGQFWWDGTMWRPTR